MKRVLWTGSIPSLHQEKLDCINIFVKDNRADKVCSKLIASMDWWAASCNKQPHRCHSLQSTDYKTWTSFYRSGCGITFLAGCFCNINFTKKEGKISSPINVNVRGNHAASWIESMWWHFSHLSYPFYGLEAMCKWLASCWNLERRNNKQNKGMPTASRLHI